jgi:hypothetical protein
MPALVRRPQCSKPTFAPWLGWHARPDFSPALRCVPHSGSVLEKLRRPSHTNHARSIPRPIPRRVLGQTLESRLSPARPRPDLCPLHKHLSAGFASLAVFVVSGLIHDLVISVPARAGFGLPTAYCTFQGLGVLVERSPFGRHIGLGKGLPGFLFLLVVTTAPIFWLFHPAFVLYVIIPFMQEVRAL